MSLYWTIFKAHIRSAASAKNAWVGVLVALIFAVVSILYGLILGLLYSDPPADFASIPWPFVFSGVGGYGLLALVVSDFFPNFRMKNRLYPEYFPVSWKQAWITDLLFEGLRLPILSMVLFCTTASLFCNDVGTALLLLSLPLGTFSAMLASDMVRFLMRYSVQDVKVFRAFAVLSLILSIGVLFPPVWLRPWLNIALLAGSLLLSAKLYKAPRIVKTTTAHLSETGSPSKLAVLFVWRTPAIRNALLIGVAFKLIIPLYLKVVLKEMNTDGAFLKVFFMAALLSPSTVFTYIGANFWGASSSVWFRLRVAAARPGAFLRFQLLALSPFLIMDAFLSAIAIAWLNQARPEALVIYLANTISLLLLAQWLMLWFPRKVTRTLNFKQNNVHFSFSLTSLTAIMINYSAGWYLAGGLSLVIPVILVIAYTMDNPYHMQTGRRWSHQFYVGLFKPE